jgi:hypothetical protein
LGGYLLIVRIAIRRDMGFHLGRELKIND